MQVITLHSPGKNKAQEAKNNAFSQIRTDDLLITSEVPYQLGHKGGSDPGEDRTHDLKINSLTP